VIRSYHASCLSILETTATVGLSAIQIYGFTYFILPQYSPPQRATSVRRNFAEVRKWTLKRGCHYPQRHQHQYLSGRYWWLIGCSHATTTLDTVEDCCRSLSECHGTSRRFLGDSKLFCHRWGGLKTRDWKTRDLEKYGGGKRRTKFPGWKTHDHHLWNAKWISIKLKGTVYDMYILL